MVSLPLSETKTIVLNAEVGGGAALVILSTIKTERVKMR